MNKAPSHPISICFFSGSQVLPSYRAAFELVSACVKGRCLLMSDVKLGCEGCWGMMGMASDASAASAASG